VYLEPHYTFYDNLITYKIKIKSICFTRAPTRLPYNTCVLYKVSSKIVDHHLLHCFVARDMFGHYCSLFGVQWVITKTYFLIVLKMHVWSA
jgi:hypothetical protein